MRRGRGRGTPLLAALALAAWCTLAAPAGFGGTPGGRQHTAVSLIADVRSIQPGARFTVGVLMKMDAGWHTYWRNPGEAGLATEIRWKLPSGFLAGAPRWPLPRKIVETGDVLTYAYGGETMLLVPFTAPAGLAPGSPVKLSADVSWLECEKLCVPGKASVSLALPVEAAPPAPDNTRLFAHYRALVPGPLPDSSLVRVSAAPGRLTLRIPLPLDRTDTAGIDFYPEEFPGAPTGRAAAVLQGKDVSVDIPLAVEPPSDSARVLTGVLVFGSSPGGTGAQEVRVALRREVMASLSAAPGKAAPGGLLDRQFTVVSGGESQPLVLYLVFAFIGGLLLNIMPCVLPVVALKIFGLVRMAGDSRARIRRLGWSFTSGILFSFLLLAGIVVLLQAAGQQVGWGFQFQEPLFVIAMCAVVFAFGLSLFGVFEIRLPARAVEGVGNVLQKPRGGYGASFAEGVFATVLATPCTAPFLGAALGFAFSQPAWAILLIFATVAAGMAVPYLLLTAIPAWVRFLPKPGMWMETAKQLMGFLMMATLVWLLYILGREVGVEGMAWTAAFLLTIGFVCWMIGRFLTLEATRGRALTVWAIALVLTGAGYLLFIAPVVRSGDASGAASASGEGAQERGGLLWEPFSTGALETHLRENRAVLVDFTAEWCLTCKVNERTVLADRDVVEKIRTAGIVTVRADWTNRNPDITRLLAKFGRSGVPLYVLFPAGRPSEPIVLPEVITSAVIMEAVDRAIAKNG